MIPDFNNQYRSFGCTDTTYVYKNREEVLTEELIAQELIVVVALSSLLLLGMVYFALRQTPPFQLRRDNE